MITFPIIKSSYLDLLQVLVLRTSRKQLLNTKKTEIERNTFPIIIYEIFLITRFCEITKKYFKRLDMTPILYIHFFKFSVDNVKI